MNAEERRLDEIRALLEERRACELRGLDDRVEQVDEQLALRGYEPPAETHEEAGAARQRAAEPGSREKAPRARRTPRTATN